MLLLTTATDFLELQSGSPVSTDWTASWVDTNYAAGQLVPGSAQGNVTTAGTIVIVGAPAAGFERQLKYLSVVNRDPLLLQTAIVDKNSGGVAASLTGPIALSPGDSLQYVDSRGFSVLTAQGQEKFVGLPGPQGVPGPAGVTFFLDGDPGEDGASTPGAAGAPGPTGPAGPAGPAGFGPPGLDGDAGEDAMHIPGSQGVPGAAGAVGPAGPATFLEADAGETGDVGPPGIQGLQGVPGSTGSQGPVGPAAFLEADAGDEGPAGPPGAAGGAGPAGSTGAPGPTGPAVFLEADVLEGDAGAPGTAGIQGPAGAPGAQGPFGYLVLVDDTPGDDGQPGPPGASGAQGAAGATGLTGGSGFEILFHEIQAEDQWPQGVPYDVGAREYSGPVKFATGTTTLYPTIHVAGTNLTTPLAGVTEYDGTVKYFTPAAASRAVDMVEYFDCLSAAFTLVSQTAAQKMFNSTANGALTLPVGTYFFECEFSLTALSATSGSFGWTLAGGATFTVGWWAIADKVALVTATSPQMSYNTAANIALTSPSTATAGYAKISGVIRVTVTGTVIPQISQGTAAAAVVGVNSFFRCRPIGNASVATVGNWS